MTIIKKLELEGISMRNIINSIKLLAVTLALGSTVGCIQTGPIPGYARVGDQIVVGLGGIHRNAQSNYGLHPSDLTATLTDIDGNDFDLTVVDVFKAYPDYLSDLTPQTSARADFPVFDGGWFAVVDIDDENPGDGIDIALGLANIAIQSLLLTETANPFEGQHAAQPIEIIAGTSSQGNFADQFQYYAPSPNHTLISPSDIAALASETVGGAFIQIDYTDDTLIGTPMILPVGHHPFLQLTYNVQSNGDGTGSILVILMNPDGFVDIASRGDTQCSLQDLTIGFQVFDAAVFTQAMKDSISINVANSYYIDIDGAKILGVAPQLL